MVRVRSKPFRDLVTLGLLRLVNPPGQTNAGGLDEKADALRIGGHDGGWGLGVLAEHMGGLVAREDRLIRCTV